MHFLAKKQFHISEITRKASGRFLLRQFSIVTSIFALTTLLTIQAAVKNAVNNSSRNYLRSYFVLFGGFFQNVRPTESRQMLRVKHDQIKANQ